MIPVIPSPSNSVPSVVPKSGYTTGTCAAAASKAAALLLCGVSCDALKSVSITLPDGHSVEIPIARVVQTDFHQAEATVIKDAGDDPDITHGSRICARIAPGIGWHFEAGEGVGTVTKAGLQIPPGEAAINPGPRALIRRSLEEVGLTGARICISIPGGEALAQKTFNPRLGVVGGLSILGTDGRVRPFSLKAVQDTIDAALSVAQSASVQDLWLVPGHLGEKAARNLKPDLSQEQLVEVSNEWGHALKRCQEMNFSSITLVGHPGKLAKLALGYFDTHSAKSPSPLPYLQERLLGMKTPHAEFTTVEGLFQSLTPPQQKDLSIQVCEDIQSKIYETFRLHATIVLSDMRSGIYGVKAWENGTYQ